MKKYSLLAAILIVTGVALSVGCNKKKSEQPTRQVPVVQDMNIQTDSGEPDSSEKPESSH